MNRREFFARFLGTAAGIALAPVLDLERLLWVPGEKTIFIPPPRAVEAFATVEWITREALQQLERHLAVMKLVNVRAEAKDFRLGDTVQVRLPSRYKATTPPWVGHPIARTRIVPLDQQIGVSFASPTTSDLNAPYCARMAGDAIAARMRETGINVIATPELPKDVDEACVVAGPSGAVLRGVRRYDLAFDQMVTRIDLFGGIGGSLA